MRNFGDRDNSIGFESVFSLETNELKDDRDFEERKEEYEDELVKNLD